MASCSFSGESLVQFVFSPTVGILVTEDVESYIAPNNLTFVQLLLPFSRITKEVFIKDGNNLYHAVKNLSIRFQNVCAPGGSIVEPDEAFLSLNSYPTSTFTLNGFSHNIPVVTPWFEAWRRSFISSLPTFEQEFLTRFIGCIFFVTTQNSDPLKAFSTLVRQQQDLLKSQPLRWFSQSNLPNFFVLINDSEIFEASKANTIFQMVAGTYGNSNCFLLNMSSQPWPVDATVGSATPVVDPWLCHLSPWTISDPNGTCGNQSFQPHGQYLSSQDHNKLRALVEDFVLRIVIPWAEGTIKTLNDQMSHRLRKSRSFFSLTRKFFAQATGTGSSGITASVAPPTPFDVTSAISPPIAASQSDSNVFHLDSSSLNSTTQQFSTTPFADDAPEQQMRRLADLNFLFQQYESAHQIYELLKCGFSKRLAWLHYAGAQEMSALSTFLQGTMSQRQYPQHQLNDAIVTYIARCKCSELALRAVLLHTEALRSRELFAEAGMCFLRFADTHDFTAGGLLLEQAAVCSLLGRRPLLRHFALRMALAGVRFARAKQTQLSARAYSLALEILSPRVSTDAAVWSLALDHINENLARQKLSQGLPVDALRCLRAVVSPHSQQLETKQARLLRDFLANYATQVAVNGIGGSKWPELELPVVERKRIKVILGNPILKHEDDGLVEARGVAFSDDEHEDAEDVIAISTQRLSLPANFTSQILPSVVRGGCIPAWMASCDSDELNHLESDDDRRPKKPGIDLVRLLYGPPSYPLVRGAVFRRLEMLLDLQNGRELSTNGDVRACRVGLVVAPPNLAGRKKVPPVHCLPLGEQLTLQIPLQNPWKVPLVMTDVHLIWQASLTGLPTQSGADVGPLAHSLTPSSLVVSNEDAVSPERLREARKYVLTETLNELYLLAGDRKLVELSIQVRQYPGDLEITGLAFKLHASSPYRISPGSPAIPVPVDLPSGGASVSSTSSLAPGISLDCLTSLALSSITPQVVMVSDSGLPPLSEASVSPGSPETPRDPLNFKSVPHSDSALSLQGKILFGSTSSDPRFHWKVVPPIALLKAVFGALPQHLLEGEMFGNTLTFVNVGSRRLTDLHVACSWPGFVFVMPPSDRSSSNPTRPSTPPFIFPIGEATSSLEPSASHREHFWIRGPPSSSQAYCSGANQSVSRSLHFVFGYKTLDCPEYRFLRHEASLRVSPSLRFTANCVRTHGADVRSLIVLVRCKNASLQHSFCVAQLTSMSQQWDIQLLAPSTDSFTKDGTLIAPAQEVTFCLRASRSDNQLAVGDHFSSVSLASVHSPFIDATAHPSIDFFRRSVRLYVSGNSEVNERPPNLDTDLQPENLFLVAFWQVVSAESPSGVMRRGQSHVRVVYAQDSMPSPSPSRRVDLAQMLASIPSLLPLSSLVRLRLHHPFEVKHDFGMEVEQSSPLRSDLPSSALATIPVIAEVYNASSSRVTARLSTNSDHSKRSPMHSPSTPSIGDSTAPWVLWSGFTLQQVTLAPGETRRLSLSARVAAPGVYEVNSLCLRASPIVSSPVDGDTDITNTPVTQVPFVRQLSDLSSLVVVSSLF